MKGSMTVHIKPKLLAMFCKILPTSPITVSTRSVVVTEAFLLDLEHIQLISAPGHLHFLFSLLKCPLPTTWHGLLSHSLRVPIELTLTTL